MGVNAGALWRIELLGWLRARRDDQVVTRFRSQKAAALLAYLAYHQHRSHPRVVLVELLWPESTPEAGRRNLRVELTALRHRLEPPGIPAGTVIAADPATVQLQPACITDVAQFEALLGAAGGAVSDTEQAALLAEAITLYAGPLLPGFYEEWILPERQRLEEQFLEALRRLITLAEEAGDLHRALQYAHRAVSADPLREEAHRELIRLQVAAGQSQAALQQYRELERMLRQELDAHPSPATLALVAALHRGDAEDAERVGSVQAAEVSPIIRSSSRMEPVGGAVLLDSPLYVVRPVDREFTAAIARRDSIVLVKGTRQVGKTSLLARGLQQARQAGARVVRTDFQMFNADCLESAATLMFELAQSLADQLNLEISPAVVWNERRGPNPNFQRYLERQVLGTLCTPLVWALDQVDRLFLCDFGPDLFGMFRSWHNERALDPTGPWSRLTLAIGYTTEAHLFIPDADQSPFNVGTRLTLEDFTLELVADLNRRHGSPLEEGAELNRFYRLVGGHPYLVRRGLHEMTTHGTDLPTFEARADREDWIYGAYLRRLLMMLQREPELCDRVRRLLQEPGARTAEGCLNLESFYRLRSAGVLVGDSPEEARPRCQLYASYLKRHLR